MRGTVKILQNRYAWGPLVGSALFLFLAAALLFSPYWAASIVFLWCAGLLAGCFLYEHRKRVRRKMEREWWARQKRGIRQAPLSPCCMEYEQTGAWHDDVRCTRDCLPALATEEDCSEAEWTWLLAEFNDTEQGEA